MSLIELLNKILGVIINAINIKRKKDAANDVVGNLSGDGNVMQSDKSFSDLAAKDDSSRAD